MNRSSPVSSLSSHGWKRLHIWLLLCLVTLTLTACPLYGLRDLGAPLYFAGRLALSQEADPRIPGSKADSWSAHFELAGSPAQGTLRLSTPVGSTIAQVDWQPGKAVLTTSEETQNYESLDALTQAYFEQTIPIAALFDWLQGKPTEQVVPGWEVNLTRAAGGVISAERQQPAPRVRLRAIVDEHDDNTTPAHSL